VTGLGPDRLSPVLDLPPVDARTSQARLRPGLRPATSGQPCRTLTTPRHSRLATLLLRHPVHVSSLVHLGRSALRGV